MDVQIQQLKFCAETDNDAWQSTILHCEERGFILCSMEDYLDAYAEALDPPYGYAVTRTTTGCESHRHKLLARGGRYMDESDGCHDNRGCFPDHYFNCCIPSERSIGTDHAFDRLDPIVEDLSAFATTFLAGRKEDFTWFQASLRARQLLQSVFHVAEVTDCDFSVYCSDF